MKDIFLKTTRSRATFLKRANFLYLGLSLFTSLGLTCPSSIVSAATYAPRSVLSTTSPTVSSAGANNASSNTAPAPTTKTNAAGSSGAATITSTNSNAQSSTDASPNTIPTKTPPISIVGPPSPGTGSGGSTTLTRNDAFILLERTGFQPTQAEINNLMTYKTRQAAVAAIVNGTNTKNYAPLCPWMTSGALPPFAGLSANSMNIGNSVSTVQSQVCANQYLPVGQDPTTYVSAAMNSCLNQALAIVAKGQVWTLANMNGCLGSRAINIENVDRKDWITEQMILTPTPLTERMVLFWHNHFTTQEDSIPEGNWLMWNQEVTIRNNATGNFQTFLLQMIHDAALLEFLDQQNSVYTKPTTAVPNPPQPTANFAREFLELFTMGQGNYVEFPGADGVTIKDDITETARAFSGLSYYWKTNRGWITTAYPPYATAQPYVYTDYSKKPAVTTNYDYVFPAHDPGSKTILGKTGNWQPDDVVNIVLNYHKAAGVPSFPAQRIVTKLYNEFVATLPYQNAQMQAKAQQEILAIAANFEKDWEIKPVLIALFNLPEFYTPGTLVKSPAEFVVGAVRSLGLPGNELDAYRLMIESSGERLYEPPNVAGFQTGPGWLNTATLTARQTAASQLANLWFSHVYQLPAGVTAYTAYPINFYTTTFAPSVLAPGIPPMLGAPAYPTLPQQYIQYPLEMTTTILSDSAYYLK